MDTRTSLYAYADIVCYSRLNAYQQAECHERLARVLDEGLADAGVCPDSVHTQDHGDAQLLTLPEGTEISRVLAVMPRRVDDKLRARNTDTALHARMRVRLAFATGPSTTERTAHADNASITVVRLCNAPTLREAMTAKPGAHLGVIIHGSLYREYVLQASRPDIGTDEYLGAHVSLPEKGFEAAAWIRLVGYPAQEWRSSVRFRSEDEPRVLRRPANPVGPGPGSRTAQAARGNGENRRRRKRLNQGAVATVIAAVLTAGVSAAIAFYGGHPQAQASTGVTDQAQSPGPISSSSPSTQSGSTGPLVPYGAAITEYADWSGGVEVYADNRGTASDLDAIPFNQLVKVSCVARNDSGIRSINAFYLIASGPWKGTYASANEFTNGGRRETASDPSIDRRVRSCPAS